jgi:hypothetical protein
MEPTRPNPPGCPGAPNSPVTAPHRPPPPPQDALGVYEMGARDQEGTSSEYPPNPEVLADDRQSVLIFRGRPVLEVKEAGLVSAVLPRGGGKGKKQLLLALQDAARSGGFNAVYGLFIERESETITATALGVVLEENAYHLERSRSALVKLSHALKAAAWVALIIGFSGFILSRDFKNGEIQFQTDSEKLSGLISPFRTSYHYVRIAPAIQLTGTALAVTLTILGGFSLVHPRRGLAFPAGAAMILSGAFLCIVIFKTRIETASVDPDASGFLFEAGLFAALLVGFGARLIHWNTEVCKIEDECSGVGNRLDPPLNHLDDPIPLVAPLAKGGPKDFTNLVMKPTLCPHCGRVGVPVRFCECLIHMPLTFVLFVLFVVPGLLYLRARRDRYVCRRCGRSVTREQLAYEQVAGPPPSPSGGAR